MLQTSLRRIWHVAAGPADHLVAPHLHSNHHPHHSLVATTMTMIVGRGGILEIVKIPIGDVVEEIIVRSVITVGTQETKGGEACEELIRGVSQIGQTNFLSVFLTRSCFFLTNSTAATCTSTRSLAETCLSDSPQSRRASRESRRLV